MATLKKTKKGQWVCGKCEYCFFNNVDAHRVLVRHFGKLKVRVTYLYMTVECPNCGQINHCISKPYTGINNKGVILAKEIPNIDGDATRGVE